MYVTRLRSLYKSSPEAIFEATPEGPNSGFLVIGRSNRIIKAPPFPQNKILCARYSNGDSTRSSYVLFISVINQPLSSNRYYMISAEGDDQGLAYECSTEEDMETNCCCTYIAPRKPRRLNPLNIYQQFEVSFRNNSCKCKSVAHDGVVKGVLEEFCEIYPSSLSKHESLEYGGEASGLNSAVRNRLPSFDFPLSRERTPSVVVGKWVCPFVFIREGRAKERMKKTPFYEMTLEQRWEKVFSCENMDGGESSVALSFVVTTETVKLNGKDAVVERNEEEGVLWLWIMDDDERQQQQQVKVGLSLVIVERIMWEEERVGWVKGNERQVLVGKVESFGGEFWRRYGCYVLVERFVLRRMDGSLVLTYEFRHTQKMKSKWE